MNKDDDVAAGLRHIDATLRRMISGDMEPYAAGWEVWGKAFSLAKESPDLMWPLWLIWGALTDRVEVKPSEKAEAEADMRRAAREWLDLDPRARKAYLDRWVFDELGYERRQEPSM